MFIDDIISFSSAMKPISGEFPTKPKGYYTVKQWLNYGYKVKMDSLVNGGKIFAMYNQEGIKGYKYFCKNDCEPMTKEEQDYFQLKYKHSESNQQSSFNNNKPTSQRVMGTKRVENNNNLNTNVSPKKVPQNQPVFGQTTKYQGQTPYFPKIFEGRRVLSLNVETTGDYTKGSPKYGDEALFVSISQGNISEPRSNQIQDIYMRYLKPQKKTHWEKSERKHHITPKIVEDSNTFNNEKERIQSCFRPGDIVISYGDESFKFLEESGIVLPKIKIDLKETFFKHHQNLDDYTFTNFLKFYGGEKTANMWRFSKEKEGVDVRYKSKMFFVAAQLQYKMICNEIAKRVRVPENLKNQAYEEGPEL